MVWWKWKRNGTIFRVVKQMLNIAIYTLQNKGCVYNDAY